MSRVIGSFVGRVTRSNLFTNANGKQVAKVKLEGSPIHYGSEGKQFRVRVEFETYFKPEVVAAIPVGDWVVVSGDIKTETYEHNGKTYAALIIKGDISRLDVEAPPPVAARPTTPTTPKPATDAEPVAEDDDVPF